MSCSQHQHEVGASNTKHTTTTTTATCQRVWPAAMPRVACAPAWQPAQPQRDSWLAQRDSGVALQDFASILIASPPNGLALTTTASSPTTIATASSSMHILRCKLTRYLQVQSRRDVAIGRGWRLHLSAHTHPLAFVKRRLCWCGCAKPYSASKACTYSTGQKQHHITETGWLPPKAGKEFRVCLPPAAPEGCLSS